MHRQATALRRILTGFGLLAGLSLLGITAAAGHAEAGGKGARKATASGTMMRLGGPVNGNRNGGRNGNRGRDRSFDAANTGYGQYGSLGFANGGQRFDGVPIRQLFLKQQQEGSGG